MSQYSLGLIIKRKIMAWHADHKAITKNKILESAAKLFNKKGFERVSIDEVMTNAKLTRGAFYSHFSSKSHLYSQAVFTAALLAKKEHSYKIKSIENIAENYLTPQHRDETVDNCCPLAFLISDITQQDTQVKNAYTKIFQGFLFHVEQVSNNSTSALQSAALMIGGLALAKAIEDKALSDKLLNACQLAVAKLND